MLTRYIRDCSGDDAFLSPFSDHPIVGEGGHRFKTAYHYYFHAKFGSTSAAWSNAAMETPAAKKVVLMSNSRRHPILPRWDERRYDAMRRAVLLKLRQHPHLVPRLVETGRDPLTYAVHPSMSFWSGGGGCKNMFGKLLSELREEYSTAVSHIVDSIVDAGERVTIAAVTAADCAAGLDDPPPPADDEITEQDLLDDYFRETVELELSEMRLDNTPPPYTVFLGDHSLAPADADLTIPLSPLKAAARAEVDGDTLVEVARLLQRLRTTRAVTLIDPDGWYDVVLDLISKGLDGSPAPPSAEGSPQRGFASGVISRHLGELVAAPPPRRLRRPP